MSYGLRSARRLPVTAQAGAIIVTAWVLVAIIAAVWTPYDPYAVDIAQRLSAPSADHWLGTDRYGRDTASRLMAGATLTMGMGVVALSIALLIGTPLGVVAALHRHRVIDALIMRGADIVLAFPALLLAIIAGAVWGPSTLSAMIAIGISGIPSFARVARAGALQVVTLDYIAAARISQVPQWRIALRHILPNIAGMIIVQSSVFFALAILAEAGLSYLGLGTAPPAASWGRMLHDAQTLLATQPWAAVFPALAIALTVIGFNLLGDGLSDLLDPARKDRR